jgi:predicted transcriptional regulator
MLPLGDLEKKVMEALWDSPEALTAIDLRDRLSGQEGSRELAQTTVLTVLSRLEDKGYVTRARDNRPHRYRPVTTRANFMAELMHDVLGAARDREAVLARFVGGVSEDDAAALRRILAGR